MQNCYLMKCRQQESPYTAAICTGKNIRKRMEEQKIIIHQETPCKEKKVYEPPVLTREMKPYQTPILRKHRSYKDITLLMAVFSPPIS